MGKDDRKADYKDGGEVFQVRWGVVAEEARGKISEGTAGCTASAIVAGGA